MNRTESYKMVQACVLLLISFLFCQPLEAKKTLVPTSLTCEYLQNPQVLDSPAPRLAWINQLTDESIRGERQTAWQVCVASSKENLLAGKADVWDSGKIKEESSPYIIYKGKELQSAQTYWWRVRVWNKKGKVSKWSEPACWTMGLLKPDDWKAKWIGAPWEGETAREYTANKRSYPAPLLRTSFKVEKDILSAKAFVTGLGYFELYINGGKVGEDVLSPNQTNYDERQTLMDANRTIKVGRFTDYRVMYVGYDITDLLTKGENVVGCILGNGFYNSVRHWIAAYATPRFLGQIEITYTDGTKQTIVSDESWLAHESAIRKNDVYEGEIYDARYEINNWAKADCDLKDWQPAILRKAPGGKLTAQNGPADRVMERLSPVDIKKLGEGSYEVDFGEEISGWLKIKDAVGSKGDTIRITHISESPNGENIYVMKGEGKESYSTRFTWYVFRKVRIDGWKGELRESQLVAEAVNSYAPQVGFFECSNPLYNTINKIWRRSQWDNMHGSVASDCPHRERSAYTGDGQVACSMVMHNLDVRAFYNKWIRDIRDAQDPETGYVPNGAPWQPGCGGGVPWGAAMNIMPWEYYLQYGDMRMLEENYEAMKRQLRFMDTWKTPEGTMHSQDENPWKTLGDWCPAFDFPSKEIVHTFYYWMCYDITAQAAQALGETKDAKTFSNKAEAIKNAFHKKFYNKEKGTYGEYGCNVFALKMGVPAEEKERVVDALQKEIAAKDNHLTTGIFGTRFLFEILSENGLHELACTILNKRDYPSFGYWIEQGATTTWEQWDGQNSRNHPMFGGGLTWFYRYLAGVKINSEKPGYKHFEISPMLPTDMAHASYTLQTVYGELRSAWKKDAGNLEFDIKIPVGCTADVKLPISNEIFTLTDNGKDIKKQKGIVLEGVSDNHVNLTLSSGNYQLRLAY